MNENTIEHTGGCLCGAIRYTVHGDPTYSGNCHCCDCRRAIGAGVVTWIGVKPENFEVTSGEVSYCETSPGAKRGFCGRCGSSLTMTAEGFTDVAVTAGSLDDPEVAKPESNVFLDHKPSWIVINASLRNYDLAP